MLLFFSAFFFSLTGWPAAALTPEEKLADPILEDRARALSKQLRCLVCQNQSIDDSDADLAKDLRREVLVPPTRRYPDELMRQRFYEEERRKREEDARMEAIVMRCMSK